MALKRGVQYKTRQREAILSYIASLGVSHVTAAQIVRHFMKEESSVGRATVYRHLNNLTESGLIRKYTIDGVSGSCYQFAQCGESCGAHMHLKCEDCGELVHLECGKLNEIQSHVFNEHSFRVNSRKTVLYGKCAKCINNA
jgi:Fur family ferric uptake transcriptional regulator